MMREAIVQNGPRSYRPSEQMQRKGNCSKEFLETGGMRTFHKDESGGLCGIPYELKNIKLKKVPKVEENE